MAAQGGLISPFHTRPHGDRPIVVGIFVKVEEVLETAGNACCSSLHSVGIGFSLVHHSSFEDSSGRRVCDPSGGAGQRSYFGCSDWSTWTFPPNRILRCWCSSSHKIVDAHAGKVVILVAEVGSSVSPCSCDQTETVGDEEEEGLGSGSILRHLDSGCGHSDPCYSIRSAHGEEADGCLVNMSCCRCRNSCYDESEHRSHCVVMLRRLAFWQSAGM